MSDAAVPAPTTPAHPPPLPGQDDSDPPPRPDSPPMALSMLVATDPPENPECTPMPTADIIATPSPLSHPEAMPASTPSFELCPSGTNGTTGSVDTLSFDAMMGSSTPTTAPAPASTSTTTAMTATSQTPAKPVFSLFLTPEQRRQKIEAEAIAAAAAAAAAAAVKSGSALSKRGKKPKNKALASSTPVLLSSTPTTPTPVASAEGQPRRIGDQRSMVDPNISKTGETHPFFQGVKSAAQQLAVSAANAATTGKDSKDGYESPSDGTTREHLLSPGSRRRRFDPKARESPFPMRNQQFHGQETIEAINGVVARLCGLDTTSNSRKSASVEAAVESLAALASAKRSTASSSSSAKGDSTWRKFVGWRSLQLAPNLGITAPSGSTLSHQLSPSGVCNDNTMNNNRFLKRTPREKKDNWTHWGKNRDQKWRDWSERPYRLQRPTEQERRLVSRKGTAVDADGDQVDTDEFESCKRVAAHQPIWQQTWESTLLTANGLGSGSVPLPAEMKLRGSNGELWTEKYRPNQGADVLGNRSNTEYLVQWLQRLTVAGWTLNPEEAYVGSASGTTAGNQAGMMRKPVSIMGIAKKRRKRPKRRGAAAEMDDFIDYDDMDDFEDPLGYGPAGYDSEEDDNSGFFAARKPLSTFSKLAHQSLSLEERGGHEDTGAEKMPPKLLEIKSNAILLSGPPGSGKTAAVYACAEESGYEVFEVSPAVRRTGKEVLGLVGEMAENHHVHVVVGKTDGSSSVATPEPAPISLPATVIAPAPAPTPVSTIHSFFKKNVPVQPVPQQATPHQYQEPLKQEDEDASMDEASDLDVDGSGGDDSLADKSSRRTTRSSTYTDGEREEILASHEDTLSDLYSLLSTTNPRQSLILLEEVDLLFDEDKGFWASIVTLLSKSRRPVVMTCNDITKIPAAMLRFQEHLEFHRPGLRELHRYLTCICKIEGFMCSSDYILSLINHCRHDVRKCIMQLQYDAGLVRTGPMLSLSRSSSVSSSSSSSVSVKLGDGHQIQSDRDASQATSPGTMTSASGLPVERRKPKRLLRISAKGIVPATAPMFSQQHQQQQQQHQQQQQQQRQRWQEQDGSSVAKSLEQELERLEVQAQYAETMSLCDTGLRMKPARVAQCYEVDQFEASKDDVVGQHFAIYKQPSGMDHLFLDQELASLVEEGGEQLYTNLISQYDMASPFVFDEAHRNQDRDPTRALTTNFIPVNDVMSRNVQLMQPVLEQSLPLQGLRFNLDATFDNYAPLLRTMIQSEEIHAVVPRAGKRAMRSGGRRHLEMLSDSERSLMIATSFPSISDTTNNNSPSPNGS